MAEKMRAALLDQPGTPFRVAEIDVPEPRAGDVLVRVRACGMVPNMRNIVGSKTWRTLPRFPAVMGLDTAGEIAKLGPGVSGFKEGDRVYVNPALWCGTCHYCRNGEPLNCDIAALQGYFGFRPGSEKMLDAYPHGGFCEYMTAPAHNLVRLPKSISFEVGARFGYLGTAFAALQAGGAQPGGSVSIVGGTGTLGVHTVLFAIALNMSRIVPLARNADRLADLKALAPDRVVPVVIDGQPLAERIKAAAYGVGTDMLVDCLARGTPSNMTLDALHGLRRGGIGVNIGALSEDMPIAPLWFMVNGMRYRGSNWFTVAQGEQMAHLARAGLVDFSVFETHAFPLEAVNEALTDAGRNHGGFVNIVVTP
jgi:alcohol dehydrogenase